MVPNYDHYAGLTGMKGVMDALIQRSEQDGSYTVSYSLNQYNKWLVDCIGVYSDDACQRLWARHGRLTFHHYHPMQYIFPCGLRLIQVYTPELLDEVFHKVDDLKRWNVLCVV